VLYDKRWWPVYIWMDGWLSMCSEAVVCEDIILYYTILYGAYEVQGHYCMQYGYGLSKRREHIGTWDSIWNQLGSYETTPWKWL
jgi:hypothetical protein